MANGIVACGYLFGRLWDVPRRACSWTTTAGAPRRVFGACRSCGSSWSRVTLPRAAAAQ